MIRLAAVSLSALLLAGCFAQSPAPTVDRSPTAQAKAPQPSPVVPSGPGYYTVKRGDTLYRIALENGQDYKDIVAWNNIVNPGSIKEGQVLRVLPPGAATESSGVVTKPIAATGGVESRPLDKPAAAVAVPAVPAESGALRREPKVNKEPYSDEAYARLNKGETAITKAPEPKPEAKPETAPSTAVTDDLAWSWPTSGRVLAGYSDNGSKGIDLGGKAGDAVLAAAEGKVLYAGNAIKGYGNLVIIGHKGGLNSVYAHNRKILVEEKQVVSKGQKIAEMGNSDSENVKLHFEIRRQGRPVDPMGYLPKR